MFQRDKAHEVSDDGLVITDGPHIVGGPLDPRTAMPSPAGPTYYTQTTTGTVWRWVGSGPWEPLDQHVPEKLDRPWALPVWAQALAVRAIDCQNDSAVFDVEGSLVFDDLMYLREDPFDPAPDPENFSYQLVPEGQTVLVSSNQQMVVDQFIEILGSLWLDGTLTVLFDTDPEDTVSVDPENFSHDRISAGVTKRVPADQQMVVDYPLEILGTLDLEGRVVVLSDYEEEEPGDNFGYRTIALGKTVRIPENQDMLVAESLDILGTLNVEGSFTVFSF